MPIYSFENCSPKIAESAYIDKSAVVIGDVSIGADSSLWPMSTVRGDVNHISIGERTSIQDGTVIHATHVSEYHPKGAKTIVGNDVTVGHRVILHGCFISDHCLIGMGAIIMDDVIVEPDVIIAAGALISPGKILKSGLWIGAPARWIRELTEKEKSHIRYSAEHYVRLKNRHKISSN